MPAESENNLAMWINSKKPTSVRDAQRVYSAEK